MRVSCVLFAGVASVLIASVLGSYDGGYSSSHDLDDYYEPSYPAPPIVHPHHGHSAGSYYHYHVPLVGQQQQHYQPQHYHQDHSHYLWPLLLLLALPLLFLPLLPLLLLPLGISLLALLAPGGMMMMMMMMMMMGGGMMMRTDTISGRAFNEMRTFGEVFYMDVTSLLMKYSRSFDLDQCPQRAACEMGAVFFPEKNGSDSSTAKAFGSFIMEQYIPKGKFKRTIKQFEKAFWTGSRSLKNCDAFSCHPTFRISKESNRDPGQVPSPEEKGEAPLVLTTPVQFNESNKETIPLKDNGQKKKIKVNFVYPSQSKAKPNIDNSIYAEWNSLPSIKPNDKTKHKRSHPYQQRIYSRHDYHGVSSHPETEENGTPLSLLGSKSSYLSMFGTPTIQS